MAAAAATTTNARDTENASVPAAFFATPVASALLMVAPGDSIAPAVLLNVGNTAQVSRRSRAKLFYSI